MLRRLLALVSGVLAVLSATAFYDRYWLWRDCFNELGRCWDSATEQVYVEQAGEVWGLFTLVFAIAAVLLWPRSRRRASGRNRNPSP